MSLYRTSNGERGSGRRRQGRRVLAAVLIGVVGLAGGCDTRNEVDQAIERASTLIYARAGGSAVDGVPAAARKETFQTVLKTLEPVATSGTASQQSSIALLRARAQAGQAEIFAADAADLEAKFISDLSVIRAHLNKWTKQNGVAASLVVYDPAKDLADIGKQTQDREAEVGRLESQRAAEQKRIGAIKAEAEQLKAQAKDIRAAETALKSQGDGASQVRKLELLEQAAEQRRRADELELQASVKMAEHAREAPKLDEIERLIRRNKTQIDLLAKAKADVNSRVETNRRLSDAAKAEAGQTADLIKKSLSDLEAARAAASSPTQNAISLYTKALADARKAAQGTRDGKTSSQLSAASYALALGDVHATRARSLNAYAISLDLLSKVRPALPEAAAIQSALAAVNQELAAAVEEAKKAYGDARTLYSGAGAKSDEEKRLGDLIEKHMAKLLSDPETVTTPDAAPAAGDAGEKPAGEAPAGGAGSVGAADAPAVEAEVRAALQSMQADMASGDPEAVLKHLAVKDEQVRPVLKTLIESGSSMAAFNAACKAKYGSDLKTLIEQTKLDSVKASPVLGMIGSAAGAGAGMGLPGADQLGQFTSPEAKVTVRGPAEAELTVDGVAQSLTLVKDAGAWKINVDLPAGAAGTLQSVVGMMKPFTDVFVQMTPEVADGKYATADDMLLALNTRLMGAASRMGPPGGAGAPKPPPGG